MNITKAVIIFMVNHVVISTVNHVVIYALLHVIVYCLQLCCEVFKFYLKIFNHVWNRKLFRKFHPILHSVIFFFVIYFLYWKSYGRERNLYYFMTVKCFKVATWLKDKKINKLSKVQPLCVKPNTSKLENTKQLELDR